MTNDTAPDTPLLRVDAITKTFGGFTALDNISVDIRKGERFGLIGPNGSGKTTLINCISGALRPQAGNVIFCGENVNELPPRSRKVSCNSTHRACTVRANARGRSPASKACVPLRWSPRR